MGNASTTLVVPIRDFNGMTRLAPGVPEALRVRISRALAERVVAAGCDAGLRSSVVSSDPEVVRWAIDRGCRVVPDPGAGLDAAAAAGIAAAGERWIVAHADLPLVSASALVEVADRLGAGPVLVPSIDGGTTVIAWTGRFRFSFGPSSFHRHLAAHPGAAVMPSAALSIDIDTPRHLAAFPSLMASV
jgi:2-phospho-L-lactate guanylyltransferase